jgi:predicted nuclease of predicted toxin-antitoxin system
MKLLLGHNLSLTLARSLADVYPDFFHVRDLGLQTVDDETVWNYAARHDLVIVSKDADFHQVSFLRGYPLKVIWIRLGNCRTSDIEALLRSREADVKQFVHDDEGVFLALG